MLQNLADAACVNQAVALLQSDLTIQGALGLPWTCHSLSSGWPLSSGLPVASSMPQNHTPTQPFL